jgi:hypothetical protein
MSEYAKTVKVLEGPWEKNAFPNGTETTDVISRTITTLYKSDGYLCEETVVREYKNGDYFDTSSHKRLVKLNG